MFYVVTSKNVSISD